LSRVELAALNPPTDWCDLAAVLDQVTGRMRPLAEKAGVRLELERPTALPEIRGDADQLLQLFVNLVDNAIKYGGGKPVRIVAEAVAAAPADCGPATGRPCLRIAVIDSGTGIAKDHIPRITERFYRVDSARSRRLRGTGLGLAIVTHVLRRHQGHLVITSELGRGSVFEVFLPAG
jgi:two-component system phosphate regulon sensor histidine kinase PhoR